MARVLTWWQLVLVGVVGGVLGGGLGLGGGFIMVPILVLLGFDRHRSHASSLAGIMFISVVGAISFGLDGQVVPEAGLVIGLGGIAGSMLGAQVMHRSSAQTIRLVFGGALMLVAVRLILGGTPEGAVDLSTGLLIAAGIVVGVAAGMIAGLAGIGGGVVIVPSSIFLLGLTQHQAQGTSLAAIVFTSAAATFVNMRNRRVLLRDGLFLGIGGAVGSVVGTRGALALTDRTLTAVFGVAVLLIALNTVRQAIRGRQIRTSV
jgi:uncharacterized protein